tara:strand:- start:1466 stop:1813 length:348 start_codon:yes stop_codon:yes gene_type:complete
MPELVISQGDIDDACSELLEDSWTEFALIKGTFGSDAWVEIQTAISGDGPTITCVLIGDEDDRWTKTAHCVSSHVLLFGKEVADQLEVIEGRVVKAYEDLRDDRNGYAQTLDSLR